MNSNAEEQITWEQRKAMSEQLVKEAVVVDEQAYARFGAETGLYVICYTGHELGGNIWDDPEPTIVYVAHNSADSHRHWDDNTGVSTVRRSLAAMLAPKLALVPVPNSANPDDKDRFTNYKLDRASEAMLSRWMRDRLRVAFLPLPYDQVEPWYLALIAYNTPVFNFQHNPHNSFGRQIKAYRLQMAEQAAMGR